MHPKQYRQQMGLGSQRTAKEFFAAKDIEATFDLGYARRLNARIGDVFRQLNGCVYQSNRHQEIDKFINDHINEPFNKIVDANIWSRLNNNGRRAEEVLFSWMRGYAAIEYFAPAILAIFQTDARDILRIGDDDWRNPATFRRSATADLEVKVGETDTRIEVQTGFQGENDIKEHKVKQAKSVYESKSLPTVCIHFDIFNGRAAFLRLDNLADRDIAWVSRQQMEGTKVFKIAAQHFKWQISDAVPLLSSLGLDL